MLQQMKKKNNKLKINYICLLKKVYLAESISLLRDSKSDPDLLTPGCIPILLENNSKIGASC